MHISHRPSAVRHTANQATSTNKSGSRNVAGQKDNSSSADSAGANKSHDGAEDQQANSGGSSFSNPMDDSDTLMRAILANKAGKAEQKSNQTPSETKALAKVTDQFQSRFAENASNKEAFHDLMQKSFGDQYDKSKAEDIRQQTLKGDFSWMPEVKLVDGATLTDVSGQQNGATGMGAYSKDNDTIYLSKELLASDPKKAEEILTEEVGHALDARINVNDAAGDEGAIFSKLSHGEDISSSELDALRSENDSGTIMVDGREVEVEYGIGSFFKKVGKKISGGIKKIGKGIKKVGKGILGGIKKIGKGIAGGIKKIGKSIKKGLSKAWSGIKKGFKKLMQSKIFNAILTVAQFIPIPIVQVAVRVINVAKAAYGVYQGVKHGSIGMIAGGIAGVAGGIGGVGKALGSTGAWVGKAVKVGNIARQVGAAHQVIAKGNFGAALNLASGYFGADTQVGGLLDKLGKANNVSQAIKNDNIFGAISAGTNLLQDFTGPGGDKFLSTINKHSSTIQKIDHARKTGDYGAALGLLNSGFGDVLKLPQGTQDTLQRIQSGIGFAQNIDNLIQGKDFKSAGDMLLNGLASQITNPATLARIDSLSGVFNQIDSAATAVNGGRYSEALGLGAAILGHPLSEGTQQFANSLQQNAQTFENFVGAVKNRDVNASSALLGQLLPGTNLSASQQNNIVNLFQHAGLAGLKIEDLHSAIDNKQYVAAADTAADFSRHLAGRDNVLSGAMDSLSELLSRQIQVPLGGIADLFGGASINQLIGGK